MRVNLSFVLHERSDSAAVRDTILHVTDHAARANRLTRPSELSLVADVQPASHVPTPGLVLTATLGLPRLLPEALSRVGWPGVPILLIDDIEPNSSASFFRAEAELALPTESTIIVAAALILRPGGRSAHLRVSETMHWPAERPAALRTLESLIQSNADQWMPPGALWQAPAEILMRGEIR